MSKRGAVSEKPKANVTVRPVESMDLPRPELGDDHPLNDIIGTHQGPVWESILKEIKRNRKKADEEYVGEGD